MSDSLYRDTRFGNKKKYYSYRPADWDMRIPDDILNCVCFLGVHLMDGPNVGKFFSFGTAFFVGVVQDGYDFSYLITARHVIDEATRGGYSSLTVRVNTRAGNAEYIQLSLNSSWITWKNEAIDVAVLPFGLDARVFSYALIPIEMFADSAVIAGSSIGVGDDLFAVGLFVQRAGSTRNIPIVRTGVIAAMPRKEEPFVRKGAEYHAYLAEMRSIGGLSGSPVFVFFDRTRPIDARIPEGHDYGIFLLGLIRGHWDLERELTDSVDVGDVRIGYSKGENLNTGIAVVTPAHYVLAILRSQEMHDRRTRGIAERKAKEEPTEDAPL
jgi:hypothetical protein